MSKESIEKTLSKRLWDYGCSKRQAKILAWHINDVQFHAKYNKDNDLLKISMLKISAILDYIAETEIYGREIQYDVQYLLRKICDKYDVPASKIYL